MKRKLTKNKLEYKKQIRRINKFVRRFRREGWEFDFELPELPESGRVTAAMLRKLKAIKPSTVRKEFTAFVDFTTGEVFTPEEGREILKTWKAEHERRLGSFADRRESNQNIRLANYPDYILNEFRAYLLTFPEQFVRGLLTWFDRVNADKDQRDALAYALENVRPSFHERTNNKYQDSGGKVEGFISDLSFLMDKFKGEKPPDVIDDGSGDYEE